MNLPEQPLKWEAKGPLPSSWAPRELPYREWPFLEGGFGPNLCCTGQVNALLAKVEGALLRLDPPLTLTQAWKLWHMSEEEAADLASAHPPQDPEEARRAWREAARAFRDHSGLIRELTALLEDPALTQEWEFSWDPQEWAPDGAEARLAAEVLHHASPDRWLNLTEAVAFAQWWLRIEGYRGSDPALLEDRDMVRPWGRLLTQFLEAMKEGQARRAR